MLRSGFSCVFQATLVIFPSPYLNLFIAPTFMAAAACVCAVSLLASQHGIAMMLVSTSVSVKGHMIMISFWYGYAAIYGYMAIHGRKASYRVCRRRLANMNLCSKHMHSWSVFNSQNISWYFVSSRSCAAHSERLSFDQFLWSDQSGIIQYVCACFRAEQIRHFLFENLHFTRIVQRTRASHKNI